MKKYLIKIFSVFLAVWMVTITGGLHIYGFACSFCDVQEMAITNFDQFCSEANPEGVCCEVEQDYQLSSCEQTPITDLIESKSCPNDNCCTVSHNYIKLDQSFNTTGSILLKSFPVLSVLVRVFDIENIAEQDVQDILAFSNSSPPGFTGKAFLIFTHNLKVPLSL